MTREEIIKYNKRCAEFLIPDNNSIYYYLPKFGLYLNRYGEVYYEEVFKIDEMKFHSDWDWIMEVVEAIEKVSKYTIMNKDLYSSFDIGKHSIKFYFSPNNNYLLHLELRQCLPDEIWKHSGYKHHIIKEFDFKKDGKKAAVVEAINQFLIWNENNNT